MVKLFRIARTIGLAISLLALGMVALPPGIARGAGLGDLGGLGGIGGLPRTPLPPPRLPPVVNGASGVVGGAVGAVTRQVQQVVDNVGRPAQMDAFERDDRGTRVVKSEVLALSPSDQSLAVARGLNFEILRQENLGALNMGLTVLRAPQGMSASDALATLRAADPAGIYDYNHVYDPSGDVRIAQNTIGAPVTKSRSASTQVVIIGLVDGGIDRDHPELRGADIVTANFVGSQTSPPSEHGTAVASVLVGAGRKIKGASPGATIYAADVYGGSATGGSSDAVAKGLSWIAGKGAAVINVSLVGPQNRMLEVVVRTLIKRGHVIVAAVGNNGPATPVAYPAAYEGVIAVTSVNAEHQIQIDANQGPEVAFSALGADVQVAMLKKSYGRATGTSFAAPLIAARFALHMSRPDAEAAARAYENLQYEALDLGKPGRDPVFGYGFLESPSSNRTALSSR